MIIVLFVISFTKLDINFIAQIYSWENWRWWGDFFKCRTEIKSVRER